MKHISYVLASLLTVLATPLFLHSMETPSKESTLITSKSNEEDLFSDLFSKPAHLAHKADSPKQKISDAKKEDINDGIPVMVGTYKPREYIFHVGFLFLP